MQLAHWADDAAAVELVSVAAVVAAADVELAAALLARLLYIARMLGSCLYIVLRRSFG